MSMNWNKCDIIAIDNDGNKYHLKDCTTKFESEEKGTQNWNPKSFSFTAKIEGGSLSTIKKLWNDIPEKPTRFEKSYKHRCPRKVKKNIKKDILSYAPWNISKQELSKRFRRGWSYIRRY